MCKTNKELNKQLHHRVKNNLQLASSLINLQRRYTPIEFYSQELEDTQKRISAVSLVNKVFLTEYNEIESITGNEYNASCFNEILKKHSISSKKLSTSIPLNTVIHNQCIQTINLDTALPLTLLINEILLLYFANDLSAKDYCTFNTCLKNKELNIEVPNRLSDLFFIDKNYDLNKKIIESLSKQLDLNVLVNNKAISQH